MEQIKIKNENNETLKAGCVVLNDKNEVLLVYEPEKNGWSFPKGHMEQEEKYKLLFEYFYLIIQICNL